MLFVINDNILNSYLFYDAMTFFTQLHTRNNANNLHDYRSIFATYIMSAH